MYIEASRLSKKYTNNIYAVNNVSLRIETGMFGLLGRNGSGKTTLMRLFTTLLEPTEGAITVLGMDVAKRENHNEIKKRIGYLPQEFGFYKDFSIMEILQYICIMRNVEKEKQKKFIEDVLQKVSLQNDCKKKYKQLSGGMKRRVGLAQAILGTPPILIVDEPTAGVDPEERIKIRRLLNEYAVNHIVLFSTHIVEDIEHSCDKLAVLDHGNVLFTGALEDLTKIAQANLCEYMFHSLDEFQKFEAHHPVISFKRTGSQVLAVVVDKNDHQCSRKDFKPSLEDAYVYITKYGGVPVDEH